MYKLLAVFLIWGAISLSEQAGNSSSNTPEAPAARKYPCNIVNDKKSRCVCRSSISGDVIDLSSLGIDEGSSSLKATTRPPKFASDEVDGWRIAWAPCADFDMFTNVTLNPDEMACKGVGFARYTETSGKICHGYGSHASSAKFYSNGYGPETKNEKFYIQFLFIAKDGKVRNAIIWLKCTSDTKSYLKYYGDKQGVEMADFSSKCCCPNQQCSSKVNPPGKNFYIYVGAATAGVLACVIIAAIVKVFIARYKRRHQDPHPVQEESHSQEHDKRLPTFHRA